ncbi:MAG TPA: hypothetical protein VFE84_13725 [Patescibacteria group bacterium]|jgi:hypothetical protein|nr:hypothetical protein [Patescibacteria group bacterium]
MARQSTAIAREIRSIRTSFNRLARSFGRIAPLLVAVPAQAAGSLGSGGKPPRRRPRLSADQRKALKLQGKYMGTMRGLKRSQRTRIKKIRVMKGIKAAIAAAQRLTQ